MATIGGHLLMAQMNNRIQQDPTEPIAKKIFFQAHDKA